MYQNYFGLKEQAFSIAVNPRYLYMSQQHKEALAHLLYGVKEGGFVMLTGEVGTGKTTIIRCLLEQMPDNTELAIILNPMSNIKELLCTICDEFGIKYNPERVSIKAITDTLQRYLLANHRRGKNTVLLIDEAQLLSREVLEQIRLLTNLETSTKKLLQIVLVGQPELNDLLAQADLRQLSQRITARFHLTPLTVQETAHYISHRLRVAGMKDDRNPFTPRIIKQIHRFTGGVPRMINILCERALVGTYGHNKSQVDNIIFNQAKKEVEGNLKSNPVTQIQQHPLVLYGTISASVLIGLGIIFLLIQLMFSGGNKQANNTNLVQNNTSPTNEFNLNSPVAQALPNTNSGLIERDSMGYDVKDNLKAQSILFDYLKFDINSDSHPCWQINEQGHQCGKAKFSTWEEIVSLNRPIILSLITSNKFRSHAILIGLQDNFALLLDDEAKQSIIELEELGPQWTGDVFYAWKKPKEYSEPLGVGDRNSTVAEVAAQFALLDSQPKPLTSRKFTPQLQERIKIFQREHKLEDDGILGERTLMKLNESLGLSTTLKREFL